jgi:hypothetical protein
VPLAETVPIADLGLDFSSAEQIGNSTVLFKDSINNGKGLLGERGSDDFVAAQCLANQRATRNGPGIRVDHHYRRAGIHQPVG